LNIFVFVHDILLQHDIIEPAVSPWANNVVLTKKADGSLYLDFRLLNNLTHKDSYPLPRICSCLDALRGAKYFSTLDLRSGFWQKPTQNSTQFRTETLKKIRTF